MHLALPPEGARFLLWCHNMISILQNLNSVNICISFLFGGKINNYLDSQYFRRYGTVPWQIQLSYKCMLVHTMSLLILCCFMLDCFWGMHYTVHIHITVLFIYILSLSASLQVPPLSQSLCTEVTRSKRILMQLLSVCGKYTCRHDPREWSAELSGARCLFLAWPVLIQICV